MLDWPTLMAWDLPVKLVPEKMLAENLATTRKPRIGSLDGVKGFLSLKTAFSHAGSFVAIPLLPHLIGFGRDLTFPVLLFAFGIGTGISKRRKSMWPLVILALAYLFGSVVNESLIDRLVSMGYSGDHPLPGGVFERLVSVATLTRLAHFADFLQPYLFFLSLAIFADRLRRPIRDWNPWLLLAVSLLIHVGGLLLATTSYHGPMSMLWSGGYRSLQYAPLFAMGVVFGAHRTQWLHSNEMPWWRALLLCVLKVAAMKAIVEGVIAIRPMLGLHESLWKDGDLFAVLAGAVGGYLMLSAYGDLKVTLSGKVLPFFERIGRRTLISLSVQTVILPLAGFWALRFGNEFVRAAIGLAAFAVCVAIVLNWDRIGAVITERLRPKPRMPEAIQAEG